MVNNVTLVGRITRDPEVIATGGGTTVCNFTIAVNRTFKNQSGEYEADFINCVVFGAPAQNMGQYVKKGNLLGVTGRIQTRNYENNMGQRVYVTEVVASNVAFLESRTTNSNNNDYSPSPYDNMSTPSGQISVDDINSFDDINDDDLPF